MFRQTNRELLVLKIDWRETMWSHMGLKRHIRIESGGVVTTWEALGPNRCFICEFQPCDDGWSSELPKWERFPYGPQVSSPTSMASSVICIQQLAIYQVSLSSRFALQIPYH